MKDYFDEWLLADTLETLSELAERHEAADVAAVSARDREIDHAQQEIEHALRTIETSVERARGWVFEITGNKDVGFTATASLARTRERWSCTALEARVALRTLLDTALAYMWTPVSDSDDRTVYWHRLAEPAARYRGWGGIVVTHEGETEGGGGATPPVITGYLRASP